MVLLVRKNLNLGSKLKNITITFTTAKPLNCCVIGKIRVLRFYLTKIPEAVIANKKTNERGYILVKLYLWTLKSKSNILSMCHEISSFFKFFPTI